MQKRYFIKLEYDGSSYHGWQKQPTGLAVQEVVEQGLSTILRNTVSIVGAGRTDSGVHARVMYAHFDYEDELNCEHIHFKLNRILPKDITIHSIYKVDINLHARFSAISRTYHYYIHLNKSSFLSNYSYAIPYKLDFNIMNIAAEYLIGTKDFKCFCKSNSDAKTNICNITEAHWEPYKSEFYESNNYWVFKISANRFLRNMVRAVVGTLINVGRNKISIDEFKAIVDNGTRSDAGESVPGNALFLWDIKYPNITDL